MIQHVPVIEVVRIVRTAQDWDQAGVIGSAAVSVDGELLPPIFLVRTFEGDVEQYLSVHLPIAELPACLLDAELRKCIWSEVYDAIDARDAGDVGK